MKLTKFIFFILFFFPALSSATFLVADNPPPKLVLTIVIDQGRADYMDRFGGSFEGGLKWLLDNGKIFSEAHHAHAITETGVGHAVLGTGYYPRHNGIIGNSWYRNEGTDSINCVEDTSVRPVTTAEDYEGDPRSSRNLAVTGLADWIEKADPESKTYGISRKDRAAILLSGKNPDGAFWYDYDTGQFVSSTHYCDKLPEWLNKFNREDYPGQYFGKLWNMATESSSLLPRDDVVQSDYGWFSNQLPHSIGSGYPFPDSSFYSAFGGTPMMDTFLMKLAKKLIDNEGLGKDEHPDYLGISFSVVDSVGHTWGPNSPEMLDTLMRLDASLAELFSYLDAEVGSGQWVVALTADHGGLELPEYLEQTHQGGGRLDDEDVACIQQVGPEFTELLSDDEDWFVNGYYLDHTAIGRNNLKREDLENRAARLLESCSAIRKVWTRTELESPSDDYFQTLHYNNYYPGRSPNLLIQWEEKFYASMGTGTGHGSPYRYDTHVPLIFAGKGISRGRYENRVETVDIPVTIGSILGIKVPEDSDGKSLSELLKK